MRETLGFKKVRDALMEDRKQFAENAKRLAEAKRTVDRETNNAGGLKRSMEELIETLAVARL
ncbi:MAG: hypothetical protein LBG43_03645 [Treponema sp.]|jgi:hypothetical protein|nr:hypothetical protein [Treponema sp.]